MRKRMHKWKRMKGFKRNFDVPFEYAMIKQCSLEDYMHFEDGTIVRVEGKVSSDTNFVKCRKINTDLVQDVRVEDLVRC